MLRGFERCLKLYQDERRKPCCCLGKGIEELELLNVVDFLCIFLLIVCRVLV